MKDKRIVDKNLLELVRRLPCLACTHKDPLGALAAIRGDWDCMSDAHHVKTRGAGGDDVATNVMPLCREHHADWHRRGEAWMSQTYQTVRRWLEGARRDEDE